MKKTWRNIDETFLYERFNALFESFTPRPGKIDKHFREWRGAHSNSKRAYHNRWHINAMLQLLDTHRNHLNDPRAVEWAIWYHDFFADGCGRNGVEASAKKAASVLDCAGAPGSFKQKVERYILATANHGAPELDNDLRFLLDFDLAILGSEPRRYNTYIQMIRAEHRLLPTPLFQRGRKAFLKHYLSRETIYYTAPFQNDYEQQARSNMQAELKAKTRIVDCHTIPEVDRSEAFQACRLSYETMREQLVSKHHHRFAIFDNGDFVGTSDDHIALAGHGSDATFSFRIETRKEEENGLFQSTAGIWSLLAEPFLDTDMPQMVHQATETLRVRGLSTKRIKRLRWVIGTALCWNILWWEWCHLDDEDVKRGWKYNYLLAPCVFIFLAPISGYSSALSASLVFCAINFLWQRYWTKAINLEGSR